MQGATEQNDNTPHYGEVTKETMKTEQKLRCKCYWTYTRMTFFSVRTFKACIIIKVLLQLLPLRFADPEQTLRNHLPDGKREKSPYNGWE